MTQAINTTDKIKEIKQEFANIPRTADNYLKRKEAFFSAVLQILKAKYPEAEYLTSDDERKRVTGDLTLQGRSYDCPISIYSMENYGSTYRYHSNQKYAGNLQLCLNSAHGYDNSYRYEKKKNIATKLEEAAKHAHQYLQAMCSDIDQSDVMEANKDKNEGLEQFIKDNYGSSYSSHSELSWSIYERNDYCRIEGIRVPLPEPKDRSKLTYLLEQINSLVKEYQEEINQSQSNS